MKKTVDIYLLLDSRSAANRAVWPVARVARPCPWLPKLMVAGWGGLSEGVRGKGRDRTRFCMLCEKRATPVCASGD